MSAPVRIPADTRPADSLHDAALRIQAGDFPPAVEHVLWEETDWLSASDELLHESNPLELAFMLARSEAYAAFVAWQRGDERQREFADFGTWLADKAGWNGPDTIYARALRNDERQAA